MKNSKGKLSIYWDKDYNDIRIFYPASKMGKADGYFISRCLFDDKNNFEKELIKRGYDIKSFKFTVTLDKNHSKFQVNCPTLHKETQNNSSFLDVKERKRGTLCRKQEKLRAFWFNNDLTCEYPLGIGTQCDASLLSCTFNNEFLQELKNRGYNINSFYFEIKVDVNNVNNEKKFPTLYKRYN